MTAYSSFQTIITKVHEEDGDTALGPFSFALLYSFSLIFNMLVAKSKASEKWQMVFGTIGYIVNYSTGIFIIGAPVFMKYILVGAGSIINGITSAYLFTCVGRYIHNVCVQHNEI